MASNIITTGDKPLSFISSKKDVTALVNPDVLKNLKSSSSLPTTFGDQISNPKILSSASTNFNLDYLLKEKADLIKEEAQLDIEYKGQPSTTSKSYSIQEYPHYLVTTPKTITDKTIALIFGGCCWASLSYMLKAIPDSILSKKRVVIVDETMEGSSIKYEEGVNFVNSKFPKIPINSISGFSKGGYQAWRAIPLKEINKYNYINLIDPSMYNSEVLIAREDTKILMIYNPSNWKESYPKTYKAMIDASPIMGKSAIKVNLSHGSILTYFLQNYSNRF